MSLAARTYGKWFYLVPMQMSIFKVNILSTEFVQYSSQAEFFRTLKTRTDSTSISTSDTDANTDRWAFVSYRDLLLDVEKTVLQLMERFKYGLNFCSISQVPSLRCDVNACTAGSRSSSSNNDHHNNDNSDDNNNKSNDDDHEYNDNDNENDNNDNNNSRNSSSNSSSSSCCRGNSNNSDTYINSLKGGNAECSGKLQDTRPHHTSDHHFTRLASLLQTEKLIAGEFISHTSTI